MKIGSQTIDKLAYLADGRPILLAGPTAAGKSALALALARRTGGPVVNADALQVHARWRILTARPSQAETAGIPHRLYGHVPRDAPYSVGHWLREVAPLLSSGPPPVIVGGTGLYFHALTSGLADIPDVAPEVRAEGDRLDLPGLIAGLDPATAARIDLRNRARVQRAWEVRRATGRGLADWQAETGPPLLPPEGALRLLLVPDREWLAQRIGRRFAAMMAEGAMAEVEAEAPHWHLSQPSARAIGAPELMAHLRGELTLAEATAAAEAATRDYARRQMKWFRKRMADWHRIVVPAPDG